MFKRPYQMVLALAALVAVAAIFSLFGVHAGAAGGVVVAMAVVTTYGTGYKNPAAIKAVEAVFAEGAEKKIFSTVLVGSADSIASVYFFGRVPSNAIISPGALLYAPAIAGLTDFSLGFAGAPKALMSDVDIHAGGSFAARSVVSIANYGQRAWQDAGLASDPGGFLDVFATLGAAATAAGSLVLSLPYSKTV